MFNHNEYLSTKISKQDLNKDKRTTDNHLFDCMAFVLESLTVHGIESRQGIPNTLTIYIVHLT